MSTRTRIALILGSALALLLTSCTSDGDVVELTAEFPDVLDLVERSMVRSNGVQIGRVTSIELSPDNTAIVHMEVQPDTGLPAQVRADLRQTNLLGERYVELVAAGDAGTLADGAVDSTRVVGDLEDLVVTGNQLLGFLAADRLEAMFQAGAIAFGGRGEALGGTLSNLESFIGTLDADADTITRLIDNLHAVVTPLASGADDAERALEVLARNTRALEEEDDRLVDALVSLNRLTAEGADILRENRIEIDRSVRRLRLILEAVMGIDGALQNLLTWLPLHNLHVPNGIYLETAQLWNDDILCGEADTPRDDPSQSCDPPNPGEPGEPPANFSVSECTRTHEECGYPEGEEPTTSNDEPGEDR